jgi:hypothetical protein
MGVLSGIVLAIALAAVAFRLGRAWGRAEVTRWVVRELARQDRMARPRGEFRGCKGGGG